MEDLESNTIPQHDAGPLSEMIELVQERIHKVIVGQNDMVEQLLAGLLADGHILIEGVPGVAKTLTAKMLAKLINTRFARIQFTPDLMPSDVLGTSVLNQQAGSFQFRAGPVFSNIVLIDEINRAPAKTQAALFEVMEERQVTIDGQTHKMQSPFMVIATQNPIEHEGTYRLPEAQLDRFMMKIVVGYPTLEEEIQILERHDESIMADLLSSLEPVITPDMLLNARQVIRSVHIESKLVAFIARIVYETRNDRSIYLGASPRASIAMMQIAKAFAVLKGRNFVIPEDILQAVNPVLRHRISLTPEREMEGATTDDVLKEVIGRLEIPR
ncbi:magnesium chelatase [Flavipsychrobacter stenotrophus]|uniref:Magnesium chelatase n=1 Tax=Flavipsychrobacter stenotrophus TaxID=2077091 RepID=A0A2S7STI1_9BACT|nr:MoxR family ATPase [Flavipsychrobacter stenotrophus]PQJ09826.1 magnesium chelatase [Flavipsychrobacter stenotrophus]